MGERMKLTATKWANIQKLMSSYWIQFVKAGNPNSSGLPQWNAYNKAEGTILEINAATMAKPGLYKREFELLEKLNASNK